MNELNKLLSSLLLLGGGFLAASFVGPPEAVDRLAHYLKPDRQTPAEGLRPLDASQVGASVQRDWPALPAPPRSGESFASPAVTASQPTAPGSQALSASWPADSAPSSIAPSGDWLTAETLVPAPAARPTDTRLTPIPRNGLSSPPSPAPAATPSPIAEPDEPAWPALRPPSLPPAPVNEAFTARKPTLEDNPYGARPNQPEPAPTASEDWGALGFAPAGRRLEAIERAGPASPTYGDHIVTDGDTLALLAERYLGNPARAGELFELNRDRLERPDVLPIGMVLKTPERQPAAPRPASPAAAPSHPSGYATLTAASADRAVRGSNRGDRRLTPIASPTESVRPATPAQEPLFARDVQWNTGGW